MRNSLSKLVFVSIIVTASAQWDQIGGSLFGSYFGVPLINETFDYIIVGGGLAGLTVANRLAQNKSVSVAVIEPGNFYETTNGNISQIPVYSARGVSKSSSDVQPLIDWGLVTTPQPQLNNQTIHYAQGRGLGGSSARNQMIYHRGSVGSYDWWAELVGDDAFAWANFLPYFEKSVNFTEPNTAKRAANTTGMLSYNIDAYNETGGPVHVSFPNYGQPASTWGQMAFKEAGVPVAQDFSSGVLNGSQWTPFTINPDTQLRSSSETSFLRDMLKNGANVHIYLDTTAMNILFDKAKTAVGVNVTTLGLPYQLKARKEIILSAGVFHSPQLLMVSGIGPAETLSKHNISVVVDLPGVGQNMHDSCPIGGVTFPVDVTTPSIILSNSSRFSEATYEYLHNRTGVLTNPGGDFISWEKLPSSYRANLSSSALTDLAVFPPDWPEIENVVNSNLGSFISEGSQNSTSATINIILVAATSRGNVTIRSASMYDKPVISVNWLSTKTDQEIAIQAYRRAREIWTYMGNITTGPEMRPGANVTSDEEILSYIQSSGVTAIHHGTSTNMMGMKNDTMAVVDSHGKVFGVQKLRVVDSSSFRFTPPGHTQGATYAHAEKLADDIKNGY